MPQAKCTLALAFFIALHLAASLGLCPTLFAQEKPNVVIFLSDDQGFGDFSLTGNQDLDTPNIDSLARDGAFAKHFYVCPVCSPTRAEFLTGRYHVRGGVYSTSTGGERLDLDESTIADAFKSAGYATAAFGKWHNGGQAPYHPNSRGFDEFYGFCSGHWGHYFSPMLEHNGQVVRGDGFVTDDFTNHAIDFIAQNKERPFFVYLPYNTPHSPMQVPDRYWDKFKDKTLTQLPQPQNKKQNRNVTSRKANPNDDRIAHTRAALAMCENIDDNVGKVLTALEKHKLAENTIVIYFCDNGPNGARFNAGLKGRKGSTDEGGVRSPLLVRWPKVIPAGNKLNSIAGAIDLFPTLIDLCQIDFAPQKPFDGISIAKVLQGQPAIKNERKIFSYWNNKLSVRSNQYRLDHKGVLYDLVKDPMQKTPVRNQPNIEADLKDAAKTWKAEVLVELDRKTPRRFTVGHPSMPTTQLPARDATPTGGLKRSSRHPNCSYLTNWTKTTDKISWPVQVIEGGTFQVDVYYCCAEPNIGTQLQLAQNQNKVSTTFLTQNDPPLVGAAHDRSTRSESQVKDFKPQTMGTIQLDKGTSELTLTAIEIPGNSSIEFRLLTLTRVD